MKIRNFNDITKFLRSQSKRMHVIVAGLADESTKMAVSDAISQGIAVATFVGADENLLQQSCFDGLHEYINVIPMPDADEDAIALAAVRKINDGTGDFLMKGLIHTDNILRAVLNKEEGLLEKGKILTHVAITQLRNYPKLLFFSDSAVIPEPNTMQRMAQVGYLTEACRAFGIRRPRLALIHFTEKVNSKFPCTLDYEDLKSQAKHGRWGNIIIDGPRDTRCAVDKEALATKGIITPLEGNSDALLFPNLEAANTFYKTVSYFADAKIAGMIYGAKCPVVVTSRGDDRVSKYRSLIAAATLQLYAGKTAECGK